MDGPAKPQIRRKPVAASQALPVRSPAPKLPGHRGGLREYTVDQLSVQTTGLTINSSATNLAETPAVHSHVIPMSPSEKSPAWTNKLGPAGTQGLQTRDGASSASLNSKPLPTVPDDKQQENGPPLPPRIRTPQPEGSSKGKSPILSPHRSPSFDPVLNRSSALGPSENPPPYSLLNPHTVPRPAIQTLRPPSPSPSSASSRPTTPTPTTPSTSASTSKWSSALSSTKDLALSILPQNYTTTKHHTVLLHGNPLIIYRGPATSLSITIFSSPKYPLPSPHQRVLYLQPRGFSGDTGTKIKTLMRTYEDWINVTPAHRASLQDVDPATVKRWEKDIARTQKRLSKAFKPEKCHVVRETHVIRIPAAAEDGYFRVVVCHKEEGQKRKPICSGPLVRIASLSTDSSVFRGAKLRTLPLEAGLSVASMMATGYVNTVAGPAMEVVQNKIDQIRPGFVQTVYDTALADTVDEQEQAMREAAYAAYQTENGEGVDVIGSDDGPEKPFPVRFSGKVVQGTGRWSERLGIPTANLGDVAENVRNHLKGVYFGWASIRDASGVEQDWHESVIFVGPNPFAPPSVVAKNAIAVHILHNFEGEESFYGAKMQLVIMGFLRPMQLPGTPVEEMLDAISQDLWLTMASLGRDNWGPHAVTERVKALPVTTRTMSGLSERMLATKERVQTKIDRIPAHLLGVRTTGAEVRDAIHGNGGYWVAR